MLEKSKVGRPTVRDKKLVVAFTAKKSEIKKAKGRAKGEGTTLPKKMYEFLYDYISR